MTIPCYKSGKSMMTVACYKDGKLIMTTVLDYVLDYMIIGLVTTALH